MKITLLIIFIMMKIREKVVRTVVFEKFFIMKNCKVIFKLLI